MKLCWSCKQPTDDRSMSSFFGVSSCRTIFHSHSFLAGSKTGAERGWGQARAFVPRRLSGRSEAERLDPAAALRTLQQKKWAAPR